MEEIDAAWLFCPSSEQAERTRENTEAKNLEMRDVDACREARVVKIKFLIVFVFVWTI